ncbi:uncharacterized protein [Procambarus clarkii]|uniref:uncharacterized protein n=1 Tax=Procambarus clarkii TaxID=6728 RepID=UPI0037430A7C
MEREEVSEDLFTKDNGLNQSCIQGSAMVLHSSKSDSGQFITDELCNEEYNSTDFVSQDLHTKEPNKILGKQSPSTQSYTVRDNSSSSRQSPSQAPMTRQSSRASDQSPSHEVLMTRQSSRASDQSPSHEVLMTRQSSRASDQSPSHEVLMTRQSSRASDQSPSHEVLMTRQSSRASDQSPSHEVLMTRQSSRASDQSPSHEVPMTRQSSRSSSTTQEVLTRDATLRMTTSSPGNIRSDVSPSGSLVTNTSTQVLCRTSSSVTVDLQSLSEERPISLTYEPYTPMDVEAVEDERSKKSSPVPSFVRTRQEEKSFVGFNVNDQCLTGVNLKRSSPAHDIPRLVTTASQTHADEDSRNSTPDNMYDETPSESSRCSTPILVYAEEPTCSTNQCPSHVCMSTQTSTSMSVCARRVCMSTQTSKYRRSLSSRSTLLSPSGEKCKGAKLKSKSSSRPTPRVRKQRQSPVGTVKRIVNNKKSQHDSPTPVAIRKRKIKTSSTILSKRSVQIRKTKRLNISSSAPKLTIKLRVRKYPQHSPYAGSVQTQHVRKSARFDAIPVYPKTLLMSGNLHKEPLSSEAPRTSTEDELTDVLSKTTSFGNLSTLSSSSQRNSPTPSHKSASHTTGAGVDSHNLTPTGETVESSSTEAKASSPLITTAFPRAQKRKCIVASATKNKKCSGRGLKSIPQRDVGKAQIRAEDDLASCCPPEMVEVLAAGQRGDLERVEELVQLPGPTVTNPQTGCTLLHAAAASNQPEVVLLLLKFISPNIVNKEGRTPAHLAAIKGHTQVLKILLADEEMNPNKRDNSNRTYKDLLSEPLLLAVLNGNVSNIESLLKMGADPDYPAGQLVRGALSRELNVTTPRQLAQTLNREYLLRWFHSEVKDGGEDNEAGEEESATCINNLAATLRPRRVKPARGQASGPNVYKMDTDPRGYVCILSYSSFKDRPDLDLEGSHSDVNNLSNVFGKMGYTGHSHSSLTAHQTKQVLTSVRDMEVLDHVGCAVFVISSHGVGNEKFLTNDMKRLSTEWVCDLFKDSECPRLKNKPKLFIFNFCRGHYQEQLLRQASAVKCTRVKEPLKDMMCFYSNSGGFMSYTFTKDGTPFPRALCRTLAKHAHNKELNELYREFLKEYSKVCPTAAPQLRNLGFTKKFYFNPVTTA